MIELYPKDLNMFLKIQKEFYLDSEQILSAKEKINNVDQKEENFEISELPAYYAAVSNITFEEGKNSNIDKIINLNINRFIDNLSNKCGKDVVCNSIFSEFITEIREKKNIFRNLFSRMSDITSKKNDDLDKKIFYKFQKCINKEGNFEGEKIMADLGPLLLANDGTNAKNSFMQDAPRQGGGSAYGAIDISDSKIVFCLKEMTNDNFQDVIDEDEEKLKEFISKKTLEVGEQKFLDKIYSLFSQSSGNLVHGVLKSDLNKDANADITFEPKIDPKIFNKKFDRTIEIIDSKTLKLQIKPKNQDSQIGLESTHFIAGPIGSAGSINDFRANVVLHLEENNGKNEWKVASGSSFSYVIEPQYVENRELF